MGDKKVNKRRRYLTTASWLLVFGGIICLVGALVTPHWRGFGDYNEGVFQKCEKNKCEDVVLFDGNDPKIDSVRVITLISLGYIVISIFLGVFSIANQDVVTFLRALSFLHVTIALSVYTIVNTSMTKLWGFYLAWVGFVFYGCGFVTGAIAAHCMKDEYDVSEKELRKI